MLARDQVGLVGQAQLDAVDLGRCTIQFGRGRGSGSDADPERLSAGLFDAARQRQQNGPGVIPGPARTLLVANGHGPQTLCEPDPLLSGGVAVAASG